jgi:hypothetical protein
VYVQANYWAELRAAPPARPRIPQGDSGQLVLKFTVGANDGTRIEALGSDPTGKLTMVGRLIDSTAGHGLDELDERSETFTVAVSPGAAVGINRFDVKLSTHYAKRPDLVGEAVTVPVEVDVTKASGGGGNLLPGFEALAAAGALAGLGLGLARRGKP